MKRRSKNGMILAQIRRKILKRREQKGRKKNKNKKNKNSTKLPWKPD